jgi:hypothetical protein
MTEQPATSYETPLPNPAEQPVVTSYSTPLPTPPAPLPSEDATPAPPEAPSQDDPVERLGRGVPDPRPAAGDFQRSTAGWVSTGTGWVETEEPPSEDDDLQGKALNATYAGEDQSAGAWRNRRSPDDTRRTTFYADDAQRAAMAVEAGDGLLRDVQGDPLDGQYGWVMDPDDGTLYVFADETARVLMSGGETQVMSTTHAMQALRSGQAQRIAQIHHSTPLAGRPVAGAGMMVVSAGMISSVNDVTGHYRDEAEFVHQSMSELQRQGANLSSAVVDLAGAELPGGRPGKQWLADSDLADDEISLTWDQFKQTEGNEPQIRRKAAVVAELGRRATPEGTEVLEGEGTVGGWNTNPLYTPPPAAAPPQPSAAGPSAPGLVDVLSAQPREAPAQSYTQYGESTPASADDAGSVTPASYVDSASAADSQSHPDSASTPAASASYLYSTSTDDEELPQSYQEFVEE